MACNVVKNHNWEGSRLKKSALFTKGYSGMGETKKELCNTFIVFCLKSNLSIQQPLLIIFRLFLHLKH